MGFLDIDPCDMTALRFNQAETARKAREAQEQRAREDRAIVEAVGVMGRDAITGLRALVGALCRRHAIAVEFTNGSAVPGHARAYASWRIRKITTPRIDTVEDGATALHEIGHILQGDCPNVEPHRGGANGRWWDCLACEADASERALRLAPFTAAMHRDLAAALQRSLRMIPAGVDVKRRAQRFISGVTWREEVHRRVTHDMRMERFAEMTRLAEEAKRDARKY